MTDTIRVALFFLVMLPTGLFADETRRAVDLAREAALHLQGSKIEQCVQSDLIQSNQPGFCNDPYGALCSNIPNEATAEYCHSDAELGKKLKLKVFRKLLKDFKLLAISNETLARRPEVFRAYLIAMTDEIRIANDFAENSAEMTTILKSAVQRSGLPDAAKTKVRQMLESARVLLPGQLNDLPTFQKYCGVDGLEPNSFIFRNENSVTHCLGDLLSRSQAARDFGLLHELSHYLDDSNLRSQTPNINATYDRLISCLENTFAAKRDWSEIELEADYWAAESMAEIIKKKSHPDALKFLRRAYLEFCGYPGRTAHPDGRFRIGVLLGRNLNVRQAMGCGKPTTQAPACTLSGQVTSAR